MSDLAIRVEQLSKQYKIRVGRYRHDTLRDVLTEKLTLPFNKFSFLFSHDGRRATPSAQRPAHSALHSAPNDTIWALKDVSLEVKKGEVVGIIGPNGAGKSTLLKILSRVTEPTDGSADIWGRVGSLLEVGTGFHPELSGRENIYLNGAILGMKRVEIDRKFDEIVDFCGLEKFIDTPVKRYSSGMYVRLAFAVAAHLETEILLVDEVLAVGDAAFQKKCLGKMGKVSAEGRTVVIVSHNLPTIASLARTCVRLENGQAVKSGPPHEVIKGYLDDTFHYKNGRGETDLLNHPRSRNLSREVEFYTLRLLKENRESSPLFTEREPMTIEVTLQVKIQASFLGLVCKILTTEGVIVFSIASNKFAVDLQPGLYTVAAPIKPNYLRPGKYRIHLSVQTRSSVKQDEIDDGIFFEIEHDPKGYDIPFWGGDRGVVRFDYQWGSLLPQ